ncbi:MAG: DUF4340 domain-containing protein, partial [Planctomycetes bacterium]|nr:DUF4340 domain-containing protein [Planctomycetota bacterium]
MNFRTTLFLAVCLAALVLAYSLIRSRPVPAETDLASTMPTGASTIAQEVIEEKLGDIVKIVVQRAGQDDWVFEKQFGEDGKPTDKWRMTAPQEMEVVRWEVERIGRQLSTLQYEVSYQPGESGAVSAAEAGLEPPEMTVVLTDADGVEVSIEMGKSASADSTYVRVPGTETILVGKSSLRELIKPQALDYRDKALWSFEPADVTRVEIVDRSGDGQPVTFAFGRDGKRWMMEAPVTAKATSKVDDLLQSMSKLRASKWYDDRPERLAAYGLEPANLSVRVTVEEEVEVAKDE